MSTKMAATDKFTAVSLGGGDGSEEKLKKKKVPRRVLHFSDGTLEEYSTDEEDANDSKTKTLVDPKTLQWMPWCIYYLSTGAKKSLAVADYCGEKLAWLLGITSPKYGYAIAEHNRLQKEFAQEESQGGQDSRDVKSVSAIDVQVVGEGKFGPSDVKVVNNFPSDIEPKY